MGFSDNVSACTPSSGMDRQWRNFLRNLGEWHGSFATLSPDAELIDSSASILVLEQGDEERLVHFHLRRFRGSERSGEPSREVRQDYRSLGRQVVFFDNGSFSKGSLQMAPATASGAEFGFVDHDRRHRLVVLHGEDGHFTSLVLIRERRAGSEAAERPPLEPSALAGQWRGTAATISADWPEPESQECVLQIEPHSGGAWSIRQRTASGEQVLGDAGLRQLLLPDSGFVGVPDQVSHRAPFSIEATWLPAANRMDRLIRRYDASGAWVSSTQILAQRF